MGKIVLLDQDTIDQIAAGEVIERPSSIVKELVENAVDAGANAVTVEIRDGGISLIRVTDNGEGIEPDQVENAFVRHATSKITRVSDLLCIETMGFRGEALSSIAAVSQTEMITKRPGTLTGTRYRVEGGIGKEPEQIGAPDGTTILVRNLFYNTPARKKFLKSPVTEAGYISELMQHLALSNPGISFRLIIGGQTKLHTSGNHNLKDIVYSIYGRDIAKNLIEISARQGDSVLSGFIGTPSIGRGNRNYESLYVNGRYVKDRILSAALEEGYAGRLMQHRYPFAVLGLTLPGDKVDVNVHPAKREVRFMDQKGIYDFVREAVEQALAKTELIPQVSLASRKEKERQQKEETERELERHSHDPEPFESIRKSFFARPESPYSVRYPYMEAGKGRSGTIVRENTHQYDRPDLSGEKKPDYTGPVKAREDMPDFTGPAPRKNAPGTDRTGQLSLFEGISSGEEGGKDFRLIGQLFSTYWLAEYENSLYIADQHAAHEKVIYERMLAAAKENGATSQQISPPMIVTLSMQEEDLLERYRSFFEEAGFEIAHFGERDYAVHAVPGNLYGLTDRELFTQMLDSLSDTTGQPSREYLCEKLAMMACKAAVKGNNTMSFQEAQALFRELFQCENPYNCPHGRPTVISMSKRELEKKFKRIV